MVGWKKMCNFATAFCVTAGNGRVIGHVAYEQSKIKKINNQNGFNQDC